MVFLVNPAHGRKGYPSLERPPVFPHSWPMYINTVTKKLVNSIKNPAHCAPKKLTERKSHSWHKNLYVSLKTTAQ